MKLTKLSAFQLFYHSYGNAENLTKYFLDILEFSSILLYTVTLLLKTLVNLMNYCPFYFAKFFHTKPVYFWLLIASYMANNVVTHDKPEIYQSYFS